MTLILYGPHLSDRKWRLWEGNTFCPRPQCRAVSTSAPCALPASQHYATLMSKSLCLGLLGHVITWDDTGSAGSQGLGTQGISRFCLEGLVLWRNGGLKRFLKAIQLSTIAFVQFWPWILLCGLMPNNFIVTLNAVPRYDIRGHWALLTSSAPSSSR